MRTTSLSRLAGVIALVGAALASPFAEAAPSHGIAMQGEPALPADFDHLGFVNPTISTRSSCAAR